MADEEHWTHGYCGTSGLFSALQFALLNRKDPKGSVVQLDRSPAFLTSIMISTDLMKSSQQYYEGDLV